MADMVKLLIQKLIGNFSLELKFLLSFAVALIIALVAAFYVVQTVAERLVMQATRQTAHDYAVSVVLWHHFGVDMSGPAATELKKTGESEIRTEQPRKNDFDEETLRIGDFPTADASTSNTTPEAEISSFAASEQNTNNSARDESDSKEDRSGEGGEKNQPNSTNADTTQGISVLKNQFPLTASAAPPVSAVLGELMNQSQNSFALLRIDDGLEFENLGGLLSASESEMSLLFELLKRQSKLRSSGSTSGEDGSIETTLDSKEIAIDGADSDPSLQGLPLEAPNDGSFLFSEAGPVDDSYYYYYPVEFSESCLQCHSALNSDYAAAGTLPKRVLRVQMDYEKTRVWTLWTFSILTTLGIATLGISLFVVHWLLRRIVIHPVSHLRDVSDAISRGNMEQRAQLDTGDELNDLSDAFNRMLRYITETQSELRTVNEELDQRVDQLAHANLQLFEANRLKSEFLANMSHELRTPLNSILGFSEVLQSFDSLNDKQKKYAANIQLSGRLLLEMINDILDLAKVEAGKMEVRATHFDMVAIASGQCDFVSQLAADKNLALRCESETKEFMVYQDQPKVQQILTNLLSNAIKFTPEGGMVTVSIESTAKGMCTIEVADTGVGIPPAEIDVIFEKFRQSRSIVRSDGLTREFSGTGLGLSICREISRLLGGEISVESQVGHGSKFLLTIPAHYQPPAKQSDRISLPVPGLNDQPNLTFDS